MEDDEDMDVYYKYTWYNMCGMGDYMPPVTYILPVIFILFSSSALYNKSWIIYIKIFFKVGAKIAKKKGPFWFLANFHKFQIPVHQSFFVLHKRLPYGKTSNFYEAYAQIKIKGFA